MEERFADDVNDNRAYLKYGQAARSGDLARPVRPAAAWPTTATGSSGSSSPSATATPSCARSSSAPAPAAGCPTTTPPRRSRRCCRSKGGLPAAVRRVRGRQHPAAHAATPRARAFPGVAPAEKAAAEPAQAPRAPTRTRVNHLDGQDGVASSPRRCRRRSGGSRSPSTDPSRTTVPGRRRCSCVRANGTVAAPLDRARPPPARARRRRLQQQEGARRQRHARQRLDPLRLRPGQRVRLRGAAPRPARALRGHLAGLQALTRFALRDGIGVSVARCLTSRSTTSPTTPIWSSRRKPLRGRTPPTSARRPLCRPGPQAARPILEETARTYQGVVTQKELGAQVQEDSGVRTKQQLRHWIGDVLTVVATECDAKLRAPALGAVVNAVGSVGDGYARTVAQLTGDEPATATTMPPPSAWRSTVASTPSGSPRAAASPLSPRASPAPATAPARHVWPSASCRSAPTASWSSRRPASATTAPEPAPRAALAGLTARHRPQHDEGLAPLDARRRAAPRPGPRGTGPPRRRRTG